MDKMTLRKMLRGHPVTGEESAAITEKLFNNSAVINASALLLYYPLKDEPDIRALFNMGKPVYLPSVSGMDMTFRLLDSTLEKGAYGIPEPKGPVIEDYGNAVIIVPALAYDHEGYRLGRGMGYYDRFLSSHSIYSIGVTVKERVLETVFREKHDIRVNELVTS
ncbi:MAG: 5-formyltetrahydrofolate cyclo-ligase [Bullifex sp.]